MFRVRIHIESLLWKDKQVHQVQMTTINQTDFQSTTKHKQTLKKSFIFYSHSEMKQNFLNDAILYHFQENKTKYVNKQKAEIVFGFWFTITIRFHLLDGSNFQHCLKILNIKNI
jgi:hypothetical protein